ncbi:hypothetical protein WSK_1247 [Novosphingobium sp. Rr 2-17]|uniref:hypothetical protein n=1 Tax=Novosphingobium sp. Rr 2-17 TaxID=555793 RepID=UPI0002697B2C|nr:hypothetical protein [Novosphingobium sp. Rr 2-17]EIZ80213.1 hypothetical protein WSK_1247 [Novosphingobium sp. Rr 2-17]
MHRIYVLSVLAVFLLFLVTSGPAPLAAVDGSAGPLPEASPHLSPQPTCPKDEHLSQKLSDGVSPESTPAGACLVHNARLGNATAARMLGDAYARALASRRPGRGAGIDLFGRQIMWFRAAAAAGQPLDEIRLAQALDFDEQARMPDAALAFYFRAARQGELSAVDAVTQAWALGRISPEQIDDFRNWLNAQAPSNPALNRAANRLNVEPVIDS